MTINLDGWTRFERKLIYSYIEETKEVERERVLEIINSFEKKFFKYYGYTDKIVEENMKDEFNKLKQDILKSEEKKEE